MGQRDPKGQADGHLQNDLVREIWRFTVNSSSRPAYSIAMCAQYSPVVEIFGGPVIFKLKFEIKLFSLLFKKRCIE